MTMIELHGIHKSYGNAHVLKGVSVDCEQGTTTCIVGPSGSGKSTLLRCINHLEVPDRGVVIVDGELFGYEEHGRALRERAAGDLERQRRAIGMVFQRFNLFPHMTALENITFAPIRTRTMSRSDAADMARKQLDRVGLLDRASAYPQQLSGGQQQRVAIARALAMRPKVMLFDEPTSALDPELVGDVLTVMSELAADGMTMIVVTHEMQFARDVADTVHFMDGGVVVESGPPAEVLTSPRNARTRSFLSRVIDHVPTTNEVLPTQEGAGNE